MSGIGFGVVLIVLVVLVYVMKLLGSTVQFAEKKGTKPQPVPVKQTSPVMADAESESTSDADRAAVAVAVYLYFQRVHDEESDVLTIHHADHSAWHHELNNHFN